LGEAAARHLARAGAKLVLGARRLERMQALVQELSLSDDACLRTDVTDRAQVRLLVEHAVRLHGRIDVMINNAGLMPQSPLDRLKIDDWDRMIDVNIKGVLYGIAAALPHMQRQKSGHFINVSSVAGHKVRAGGAVYAATKHAVLALSEGLRQEVKPYNIRTTVISPGAVATELPDSLTEPDLSESFHSMRIMQSRQIPSRAPSRLRSSNPRTSTSTKSSTVQQGRSYRHWGPLWIRFCRPERIYSASASPNEQALGDRAYRVTSG
jgi:NADP-dependent 3-hydroxy acid dehydrogenase YdfG